MRLPLFAVVLAICSVSPAARAQWRSVGQEPPASGDADAANPPPQPEPFPYRSRELDRAWERAREEERDQRAWAPAARRSLPTLWAGLSLTIVAAAGGFAGAFAHGADDNEPTGMRIALGSATLGSLALPLIPFGAQRVGYPHRAPGLMYTGIALTFIGSAAGAASFATWQARATRGPHGVTPALGLAGAGTLALGIPFWAGGSRRPKNLEPELPTPEPPHSHDALVGVGVGAATLGIAGVLVGSGLAFARDDDFCPLDFGCSNEVHGKQMGEPMMIAGTALAGAGLVMVAFGAPSDAGPQARVGVHRGGLGLSGTF